MWQVFYFGFALSRRKVNICLTISMVAAGISWIMIALCAYTYPYSAYILIGFLWPMKYMSYFLINMCEDEPAGVIYVFTF